MKSTGPILGAMLLAGCTAAGDPAHDGANLPGVRIEPSGFATITGVPPLPFPRNPPPPAPVFDPAAPVNRNPDDRTMMAASLLDQDFRRTEARNYVGMQIVRDPHPRVVFQFRRDAAAIMARHDRTSRFTAIDGGVPAAELEPVADMWLERFAAHGLVAAGGVNPFEGIVSLDIGIDEPTFRALAVREGWTVPDRLRFRFAPSRSAWTIDPALARLVRVFPRRDSVPPVVLTAATLGRITLRDGCFRMTLPGRRESPLVIFGRDTRLVRDEAGYLAIGTQEGPTARIGEQMAWAGPDQAGETDGGVRALHAKCGGSGPVMAVGAPNSLNRFRVRAWTIDTLARREGISREAAWEKITACWTRQDARDRRGDRLALPDKSCDGS